MIGLSKIGSSPRLRGTGDNRGPDLRFDRFIPAPAGNRMPQASPKINIPVHPRACGEQWRGQVPGLTKNTVHPRACGEQGLCDQQEYGTDGSSPRLRGTAAAWAPTAGRRRFIPAPAGNRIHGFSHRAPPSVHPRACGEQNPTMPMLMNHFGSSPRLRGTEPRKPSGAINGRFIPAPAGNRTLCATRIFMRPVHPRACGEQSFILRDSGPRLRFIPAPAGNSSRLAPKHAVSAAGSSPRLRGTEPMPGNAQGHPRFIPAPAGNSNR